MAMAAAVRGGSSRWVYDDDPDKRSAQAVRGNEALQQEVAADFVLLEKKKRITSALAARVEQRRDPSLRNPVDYHAIETLWDALTETDCVKLLSARWLVQRSRNKGAALQRRQDLPAREAFIAVEHLKKMYEGAPQKGSRPKRAPIVAISQVARLPESFRMARPTTNAESEAGAGEELNGEEPSMPAEVRDAPADNHEAVNPDDPDPYGDSFSLIGRMLREHLHIFTEAGYRDVGCARRADA